MFNVSVVTLMQHLIFLFLLVVAPVWDLYYTRKLKRNPSSEQFLLFLPGAKATTLNCDNC